MIIFIPRGSWFVVRGTLFVKILRINLPEATVCTLVIDCYLLQEDYITLYPVPRTTYPVPRIIYRIFRIL